MLCEIVRVFFVQNSEIKNMFKKMRVAFGSKTLTFFFIFFSYFTCFTRSPTFNKRATKCSFPKLCELSFPKICGTQITLEKEQTGEA